MPRELSRVDLLLIVMGAPHQSDQTTSVLRLVQALMERGGRVRVWSCGDSTHLTQQHLGERKQRNFADWHASYPTTAVLVRDLLTAFPEQLEWFSCQFCSEDRGATDHLPEIPMYGPSKFARISASADKTVMLGVI
ncbi:hypothetical protein [Streptomyces sp. NBRC 109706]|uniref:hypothetical protein n=1 Tax=Streptomyces sp. NBRC 109706 TaxID=1550035 RepID=UPI00078492F1|nr:hypothetical protein [Streptomyces sp. NBRC 109706]